MPFAVPYRPARRRKMKKGFTLIELLVVVLIIGILSAVALPQYQKSVEKARFSTMLPLVRSVADAQYVYHLANGEYAEKFEDLDIGLPGEAVVSADGFYYQKATLKDFTLYLRSKETDRPNGSMRLADGSVVELYLSPGMNGLNTCESTSGRGLALCKTLGRDCGMSGGRQRCMF